MRRKAKVFVAVVAAVAGVGYAIVFMLLANMMDNPPHVNHGPSFHLSTPRNVDFSISSDFAVHFSITDVKDVSAIWTVSPKQLKPSFTWAWFDSGSKRINLDPDSAPEPWPPPGTPWPPPSSALLTGE